MGKLVYGFGINDRSRPSCFDGKKVKEYALWKRMLERCFDEKWQVKYPTYKGCSVSNNFLNYTFFYDWCQTQIGFGKVDEKGRSWCLDKDILFAGNKLYSENTCVFAPQDVNKFFTASGAIRGDCTIGVYFDKVSGKFKAYCTVNSKPKHLGYYNTPQEAFAVYKPFKEARCKELAIRWKEEIDERVFIAMMNWEVADETPSYV